MEMTLYSQQAGTTRCRARALRPAGIGGWVGMCSLWAVASPALAATAAAQSDAPPAHTLPFDVVALFASATAGVQGVMVLLLVASLLIWSTLLVKGLEMRRAEQRIDRSSGWVERAPSLVALDTAELTDPVIKLMIDEARDEMLRGAQLLRHGRCEGTKERVAARLQRVEEIFVDRLSRGIGGVAGVASVAPYVGLLGTVWGIMHSFLGIAAAKSTNLSVVAPGIAEALLATGLGLVTAIPATLIFNTLVNRVARYRARLSGCSTLLMCLATRDADEAQLAPLQYVASAAVP